jgi:hypothetical protein
MTAYTFSQLFDFTRTTAGTFVGSNGLIQNTPASVNLLLYTQDFDIATWNKAGGSVTVTANSATAPDGTSTADTVTESVGGTTHNIYQAVTVVSGSAYTWSGYVKANGRSIVQFICQATAAIYTAEFDLTAVTATNRSGTGTATITAVGNGWYRITATATSTGAGTGYWQLNLCSAANTPSYSGNGTSGIFLWGAQMEVGSSVTTYTKNVGGVFPVRFEYDPVTLAPKGILIEEQRTNLQNYSAQFGNVYWTKGGTTIATDTAIAPDGTLTADKLAEDTSTGVHRIFDNVGSTVVSGAPYAWTIYVKAAERTAVQLLNNSLQGATFNLTNGAVSNITPGFTASATNVGNGWYRLFISANAATTTERLIIYLLSGGTNIYTGVAGSGVFLWGAQLEAGAFATSYIPTVASQVTRSADLCNITAPMFAPWYNQSTGTFVADFVPYVVSGGAGGVFSANSGGASNRIDLRRDGFSLIDVAGVRQAELSVAGMTANVSNRLSVAYEVNNFALVRNGGAPSTDTSGTIPTVNLLQIGGLDNSPSLALSGHIRRITYYPFRASNNQLQALTT